MGDSEAPAEERFKMVHETALSLECWHEGSGGTAATVGGGSFDAWI